MESKEEVCENCLFNDSGICLIKSCEKHCFIIHKLTDTCELFICGENADLDHYIPESYIN